MKAKDSTVRKRVRLGVGMVEVDVPGLGRAGPYRSVMQRVEQGDGQVIGPEPSFLIVAVEKHDRGIA